MKLISIISSAIIINCILFTAPQVLAVKSTALVIGNGEYNTSPLANPKNDAADISSALRQLGFDVLTKVEIDQETFLSSINLFGKKIAKAEVGLFYYAGHGVQVDGHNYLIPVNTEINNETDVKAKALKLAHVLNEMKQAGNKLNIIILDACRNNPFNSDPKQKGLARIDAPVGTIIAYATGPGSVAADGNGRNGIYTKHLLSAIKTPGVTIQEMFNIAGTGVVKETNSQQIPWTSNTPILNYMITDNQSTVGDDSFHPRGMTVGRDNDQAGPLGMSFKDPTTGMEFIYVPGGCFFMGDVFDNGSEDEKPVHEACVDSFYIGKYEVSQGEYQTVTDENPSRFKLGDNYPVEKVSWIDTQSFIKKLNKLSDKSYRLPFEAEWEFAARERGRKVRFGTGGNYINDQEANFDARDKFKKQYSVVGDYRRQTVPVYSYKPNALGLYNMAGNVFEWCLDWHHPEYYKKSPKDNPCNNTITRKRVNRGGSWYRPPKGARANNRHKDKPQERSSEVGFRLVLPAQ